MKPAAESQIDRVNPQGKAALVWLLHQLGWRFSQKNPRSALSDRLWIRSLLAHFCPAMCHTGALRSAAQGRGTSPSPGRFGAPRSRHYGRRASPR